MPIQLKVSNSIKSLSDELAQELKNVGSVFRPVYIVTQTEGMNNWLRLQLAEKLGIAANIQFPKPNDFIQLAYKSLGGSYQQSISPHDLSWLLYKALDEKDFRRRWPMIEAYYDSKFPNADRKRMSLAEKLADLFDQYQIYRTDVINAWNLDKGEDDWQKSLWRRIRDLSGEQFPDKTMIGRYITEALKDPDKVQYLQRELPVVYFFGLSLITEYHLQLIQQLSEYIDIHFMIQNPAPEDYWFEDKSEKMMDLLRRRGWILKTDESLANPLLVSWGKLVQDTFLLLFQDESNLNNYQDIRLIEPPNKSLLGLVQNSIYNNQKENLNFSDFISDGSITINSCHNPVREVEVLYNYLVRLADGRERDLSAGDIVVMVSDIDRYASYIKAIFDNAPYKFRYTIADESFGASDGIINALIGILKMSERTLTSEKVVSLLNQAALKKHFQITDTLKIRDWVDEANIRFGMYGDRAEDSDYVSWNNGLKRIMYGICMAEGNEYGNGTTGFYPLGSIEGFDSQEATRFVYFVENLMDSIRSRKKARSVADWVKYLEDTLLRFIGDREDTEDEDYVFLLNRLERYNMLQDIYTEDVTYDVFIDSFLTGLNLAKRSHLYAGGGITFCSLVPMRSIPFKVVALLGLDFDKFPRKDIRESFDLMKREQRKGDRNLKDNDKHLFLETVMSAEKCLYLSYIGQSTKDNSTIPSSSLIDEFIDFISTNTEDPVSVRQSLIHKHPLHGYSRNYNSDNPNLYSYLLDNNRQPVQILSSDVVETPDFDEIQIHEMTSFFKSPIKAYYNRTLKVYYSGDNLRLSETEIFNLDHLQKWQFRNLLLTTDKSEIYKLKDKYVKLGQLPLKNKAIVDIENLYEEVEPVKIAIASLTDGLTEQKVELEIQVGDSLIAGTLDGIYGDRLIRYSLSSRDVKYKFEAYFHYLLLTAVGYSLDLFFISQEGDVFIYDKISKTDAVSKVKELVAFYINGLTEIQTFDFAFEIDADKINTIELYRNKISSFFNNDFKKYSEPYLEKEYENGTFETEESYHKFLNGANIILTPLSIFKKHNT